MPQGVLLRSGERPSPATHRQVERLRAKPLLSAAAWRAYDSIRAAILLPGSKTDYSQLTAIRFALRDKLQAHVQRTMGQTALIRDLMPYDISGVASGTNQFARLQNKTALVANTWLVNDLGFRAVPINQAIGIYGFIQLASIPLIDGIAFTQGNVVTLGQFFLDPIYADEQCNIGFFDPPMAWAPQQQIGINLLAASAVGALGESYGLIGYVAEPSGATVLPDQTQLV
jgi:hypothetical protein